MAFLLLGLVKYLTAFVLLFVTTISTNQHQCQSYWGDQDNGQHYYYPYYTQPYYNWYDPWNRRCYSDNQNNNIYNWGNNNWDNNGGYIYPYPGDSQQGRHVGHQGYREYHGKKAPRIPYWATNFKDCLLYCKNEVICVDYCSFRFGLSPTMPGNRSTALKEWIYSFPVYVNGTWFFKGMKPIPPHLQGIPQPYWYIPDSYNYHAFDPYNYYNNYYNRRGDNCYDNNYQYYYP
nr:expressed protein [Hymenolepis microstoma]